MREPERASHSSGAAGTGLPSPGSAQEIRVQSLALRSRQVMLFAAARLSPRAKYDSRSFPEGRAEASTPRTRQLMFRVFSKPAPTSGWGAQALNPASALTCLPKSLELVSDFRGPQIAPDREFPPSTPSRRHRTRSELRKRNTIGWRWRPPFQPRETGLGARSPFQCSRRRR